jgi:hypothetical protein
MSCCKILACTLAPRGLLRGRVEHKRIVSCYPPTPLSGGRLLVISSFWWDSSLQPLVLARRLIDHSWCLQRHRWEVRLRNCRPRQGVANSWPQPPPWGNAAQWAASAWPKELRVLPSPNKHTTLTCLVRLWFNHPLSDSLDTYAGLPATLLLLLSLLSFWDRLSSCSPGWSGTHDTSPWWSITDVQHRT